MGGPNQDRMITLASLRIVARGYVRVGVCGGCSNIAALPIGLLAQKLGEDHPAEFAMRAVRCSVCGEKGKVKHKLMRLCEPGCGKQRG